MGQPHDQEDDTRRFFTPHPVQFTLPACLLAATAPAQWGPPNEFVFPATQQEQSLSGADIVFQGVTFVGTDIEISTPITIEF